MPIRARMCLCVKTHTSGDKPAFKYTRCMAYPGLFETGYFYSFGFINIAMGDRCWRLRSINVLYNTSCICNVIPWKPQKSFRFCCPTCEYANVVVQCHLYYHKAGKCLQPATLLCPILTGLYYVDTRSNRSNIVLYVTKTVGEEDLSNWVRQGCSPVHRWVVDWSKSALRRLSL
jgi:hypothetical protein